MYPFTAFLPWARFPGPEFQSRWIDLPRSPLSCPVSGPDFSRAAKPNKGLGLCPCAFFHAGVRRALLRIGSGQAFRAGRAVTGASERA